MRPSESGAPHWPARSGYRANGRVSEWLVAIFCLGVMLFSPLLLTIFNRGIHTDILGIPLLVFYLFSAWALLVGLIAWAMERQSRNDMPSPRTVEAAGTLPDREEQRR
ncbi:MAG: hypothetical protein IPK78_14600 [Rhodospirillales bacterium]|nr:hypothetical protein [Rhodospirillales bacterium]